MKKFKIHKSSLFTRSNTQTILYIMQKIMIDLILFSYYIKIKMGSVIS